MIKMRSGTNRRIQRSTSPRGAARSIRSGRSIWSPAMTRTSRRSHVPRRPLAWRSCRSCAERGDYAEALDQAECDLVPGEVDLGLACSSRSGGPPPPRAMKAGARGLVVAGSKPGRTLSDDIALLPFGSGQPRIHTAGKVPRCASAPSVSSCGFTEAHGQHSE